MSPAILSQIIYSHLHIAQNVAKRYENGHDILVLGVPESLLESLSSPLSCRCSLQAHKVLEGVLIDAHESPEDVLVAAQVSSVVSKSSF